MKCDHCHGFGRLTVYLTNGALGSGNITGNSTNSAPSYRLDPCPQCHGSGIVACCEGICEQPEASAGEQHDQQ